MPDGLLIVVVIAFAVSLIASALFLARARGLAVQISSQQAEIAWLRKDNDFLQKSWCDAEERSAGYAAILAQLGLIKAGNGMVDTDFIPDFQHRLSGPEN